MTYNLEKSSSFFIYFYFVKDLQNIEGLSSSSFVQLKRKMSWKSVYYENAGSNNWMLQEANYEITEKDIVDKLDPSDWSMKGSRFLMFLKTFRFCF